MGDECTDIRRFLEILHGDNNEKEVFELRVLNVGGRTYSGFFNSIDAANVAIEAFEDRYKPPAIYCSLNPIDATKRLATNRISICNSRGDQSINSDATRRKWLFIDVDPIRITKTNASDQQVLAAISKSMQIRNDLIAEGWPTPLCGMSGNGAYLLWRTDEPNLPESDFLFRNVVYAMAEMYTPNAKQVKNLIDQYVQLGSFDDAENAESEETDIDKSIHNAARICKVLGTQSRKGPPTELRPQRQSWFTNIPDLLEPVPKILLESLGAKARGSGLKKQQPVLTDESEPSFLPASESLSVDDPILKDAIKEAREHLSWLGGLHSNDRDSWLKIGMALHFIHDSLLADWIKFSKTSSKYQAGECEKIWSTFDRSRGVSDGTLKFFANQVRDSHSTFQKIIEAKAAVVPDVHQLYTDCLAINADRREPIDEKRIKWMIDSVVKNRDNETTEPAIDSKLPELNKEEIKEEEDPERDEYLKRLEIAKMSGVGMVDLGIKKLIRTWKLYKLDEMPVIWILEFDNPLTGDRVRIELLTAELSSFPSARQRAMDVDATIPSGFAKHWLKIVEWLQLKTEKVKRETYRDVRATIANVIIESCWQSVTSISQITSENSKINPAMIGNVAFYEGERREPVGYWFNVQNMANEISTRVCDHRITKKEIQATYDYFKIQQRKNTPFAPGLRRRRMALVDAHSMRSMCEYVGIDYSMSPDSTLSRLVSDATYTSTDLEPSNSQFGGFISETISDEF